MRAAAATNKVSLPAQSHSQQDVGITVNDAIPVGGMEPWRSEAIKKVIEFDALAQNWDGYGSQAPNLAVKQTAIDLLLKVPGDYDPSPRIVPISGGGLHFEWAVGDRELEISIEPSSSVEALKVEHGMPVEDGESHSLSALFGWLTSR